MHNGKAPTVQRWEAIEKQLKEQNTPFSLKELAIKGEDLVKLNCPKNHISVILKELHRECILNPHLNAKDILILKAERKIYKINKLLRQKEVL